MAWLTQNWIWLLLLGVVVFMLTRRGMGRGHMGGHSGHGGYAAQVGDPGPHARLDP